MHKYIERDRRERGGGVNVSTDGGEEEVAAKGRQPKRKSAFFPPLSHFASLFDPVSSFRLITAAPGREINGRNWPLKTGCLPP